MAKSIARSENPAVYRAGVNSEDSTIAAALAILEGRINRGSFLTSPQDVKSFLRLSLATEEREVFGVIFLNAQHQVICFDKMFSGTLSQTSVYPREVARRALQLNAAAVVLSHNHPSGNAEPSRADEHLTQTLKACLSTFDIRVLDHIVVTVQGCTSFAERGLM